MLIPFSLGFLGSFHCVGMCAPLAFALPAVGQSAVGRLLGGLLYNFGRIVTYTILGILVGSIGRGIFIVELQQISSIVIGCILLASILIPLLLKQIQLSYISTSVLSYIKRPLNYFISNPSYLNLFGIGLLNGLLPCGLVYFALAGAALTFNPLDGGLYLFFFGLGTVPMMLIVVQSRHLISSSFRNKMQKAIPVFIVLMGCWFVVRGLNLGIPYLSPELKTTYSLNSNTIPRCH